MLRAVVLFILLLSTGCTLSTTNEDPTPVESTLSIPTATLAAEVTATLRPTSTLAPTVTNLPPIIPTVSCIPPTGWSPYIIQRGDTLFSIAQRAGTTVTQLTTANCLSDPNQISAGQQILVPQPISGPGGNGDGNSGGDGTIGGGNCTIDPFFTPNSGSANPCPIGTPQTIDMLIQPFERGYMLWLEGNETVYVLFGRQSNSGRAEVYPFDAGQPRPPITTGTPPEGFGVPQGVFAFVYNTNRTRFESELGWSTGSATIYDGTVQPVSDTQFYTDWPLDSQILTISNQAWSTTGAAPRVPGGNPNGPIPPGTVTGTTIVNPVIGAAGGTNELQPGATVTLLWEDAPVYQLNQVEFVYYPASGGQQTLGLDADMTNGVSIAWVVPNGLNGRISAAGSIPGMQPGSVTSAGIQVVSGGNPPPTQIVEIGGVEVTPVLRVEGDVYVLLPNATVTFFWRSAPTDILAQVEFVYYPAGSTSGISIGIDSDLSDGAFTTWRVPADLNGVVIATGRVPGQSHQTRISSSLEIRS